MVTSGAGGSVAQRPAVSRRPCRQTTPGLQPSGEVHPGVGRRPPEAADAAPGDRISRCELDISIMGWCLFVERHAARGTPATQGPAASPTGPAGPVHPARPLKLTPTETLISHRMPRPVTEERWRAVERLRFVNPKTFRPSCAERRLEGLHDMPRPGAPREIDDDKIAETVRGTLDETLTDATLWRRRSMARTVGYSPSTSHRIWQAFGLQPHRAECHVGAPFMPPIGRREPRPVAGRSARLRLEGRADSRTCAGCV